MMIRARANRVCGECRSAHRAIVSNLSASHFMHRPSSVHQPVALAANRAKVAREAGIGLDLAAKTSDLHVDGAFVHGAADTLAQRFAAQHFAKLGRERAQESDLGVGERYALALLRQLAEA